MTTMTSGTVTSADGTTIGFRALGAGPGLVVLHGAMEWGESHRDLAEALADEYTVYLPDRRGRGASGTGPDTLAACVADLAAMLAETGAERVFGVSSGAIIAAEALLRLPGLRRAALYEPPLAVSRAEADALVARVDRELAAGDVIGALITGMQGAQMGPAALRALPRPVLHRLTTMAAAVEDKRAKPGDLTMRALAPTLAHDFRILAESCENPERFAAVRAQVLVLSGSGSPAYLRESCTLLAGIVPGARHVEFPKLNHGSSGNRDHGGRPDQITPTLKPFLT